MLIRDLERRALQLVSSMVLIGNVRDMNVIIVDDMADTCRTLVQASKILKQMGAQNLIAAVVHPIFSAGSAERLASSPVSTLICGNTVHIQRSLFDGLVTENFQVVQFDVSGILAQKIRQLSPPGNSGNASACR
jgi:ribose-phosphate pyrophosphokinase